jgi:hypothetical protein
MQKLEKSAESWALTAWRLGDGEVLYRMAPGAWSERFADAAVFSTRDAADTALAQAAEDVREQRIVAPYLFAVEAAGGVPASVRERIRARGPTTRLDLGKQAAGGARPAI